MNTYVVKYNDGTEVVVIARDKREALEVANEHTGRQGRGAHITQDASRRDERIN